MIHKMTVAIDYNEMEREIVASMASAQFGPPGREDVRVEGQRTLSIGWLLYGFVRASRPKTILEIGAGGSTACLLWGIRHNGMGHLHLCDIFTSGTPDPVEKEEDGTPMDSNKVAIIGMIRKWDMESLVTIHHEYSQHLLSRWTEPLDMVAIDGDHTKESLDNDVKFAYFLRPGGFALFHDFLSSLWGVGITLRDLVKNNDEWAMIVEPNNFGMAIVQRKFSLYAKNCFVCGKLTQNVNPNGYRTSLQFTDPRACGTIKSWNGQWFQEKGFHDTQPEGEKIAYEIIEYEKKTGKIVQSMDEWERIKSG